jgi:hypothetical protein
MFQHSYAVIRGVYWAISLNSNTTATQGLGPVSTQTPLMFGYKATNRKNYHNM